jgi:hypothetical protein
MSSSPPEPLPCHICGVLTRSRRDLHRPDSRPVSKDTSVPICKQDIPHWNAALTAINQAQSQHPKP